jgi:mRNA interferase RelE/StbE
MAYGVIWDEEAREDLRKLDRATAAKIIVRVREHLAERPLHLGLALTGIFKGLYRYRYGDYRVIYAIARQEVIITIVRVANRRDAYR